MSVNAREEKIFSVELSRWNPSGINPSAEIALPATPYELADALERAGTAGDTVYSAEVLSCQLDYLPQFIQPDINLHELNHLAQRLSSLSAWELDCFEGMVMMDAVQTQYCLNSRADFELVKNALARDSPASDVQRAAWFYQLIRYSYASGLTSYGSQPHDIRSNFPLIEQAHRRLAKVVIENKDFEKLIGQYDRPVSFFYCDPPYFETESYYKNVGEDGFTEKDHIRLRDALLGIEGKFLLSYNDCEFIRSLYEAPGIQTEAFTRINNIKQRYDNGAQFPEILIANYDLHEREKNAPSQLNLFGEGGFME